MFLALFKQVDIATLPTSYQTYIYVYKEGDAAEPPVGPDAETCLAHRTSRRSARSSREGRRLRKLPGARRRHTTTVATSTTTTSSSLTTSTPTTRAPTRSTRVEITEKMSELGVGPDDAVLKVVCFTNEGTWVKLEETPLPPPLVVGPSFTSTTAEISKTAGGKSDVKAVQAKRMTLGFYTGAVDGIFGDATAAAVSAFQTFAKLDVTGTANGTTKRVLLKPRFDLEKDVNLQDGDKANFEPGSTITYVVGPTPNYLEREQVLKEIAAGFRAWAGPAASGLKFKRVPAKSPKAAAARPADRLGRQLRRQSFQIRRAGRQARRCGQGGRPLRRVGALAAAGRRAAPARLLPPPRPRARDRPRVGPRPLRRPDDGDVSLLRRAHQPHRQGSRTRRQALRRAGAAGGGGPGGTFVAADERVGRRVRRQAPARGEAVGRPQLGDRGARRRRLKHVAEYLLKLDAEQPRTYSRNVRVCVCAYTAAGSENDITLD